MSPTYHVSAKGLILMDGKALLLRKPNGYWDLPGGRLDAGEEPQEAMIREIREEAGIVCQAGPLHHCFVRPKLRSADVFVVVFLATTNARYTDVKLSHEHDSADLFSLYEAENLKMDDGFRQCLELADTNKSGPYSQ